MILKSRSNLVLKPTGTEQWGSGHNGRLGWGSVSHLTGIHLLWVRNANHCTTAVEYLFKVFSQTDIPKSMFIQSFSPWYADNKHTNTCPGMFCILFIIIVWSPCSKQMSFVLLWAVGNRPHCCNFRQSYCRFFPTMLPVTYWAKLQHFYLVVFHPTKADFRFEFEFTHITLWLSYSIINFFIYMILPWKTLQRPLTLFFDFCVY